MFDPTREVRQSFSGWFRTRCQLGVVLCPLLDFGIRASQLPHNLSSLGVKIRR